jgi:hypothetical protein
MYRLPVNVPIFQSYVSELPSGIVRYVAPEGSSDTFIAFPAREEIKTLLGIRVNVIAVHAPVPTATLIISDPYPELTAVAILSSYKKRQGYSLPVFFT